MTTLSRQVKNLHMKYGKGMSLKVFARNSTASSADADDKALIAKWLENKVMPPRPAITNKFRGGTDKSNRRPRGRKFGGRR